MPRGMHIGSYDDEPATVQIMHEYMDEWSFATWGIRYWSRTPEFEAYLKDHKPILTVREERITAEEYVDFLKRTDLGSQYPKERFEERIARLVNEEPYRG